MTAVEVLLDCIDQTGNCRFERPKLSKRDGALLGSE
jgi:hypothetical protein